MQAIETFAIPGAVQIGQGEKGLTKLTLTSPHAIAEVYLHGAHVTKFRPTGEPDVLWMSAASHFESGKPIRGGVPICFPWFGPKQGDADAPGHGFVRLMEWQIDSTQKSDDEVAVVLKVESNDFTRKWWQADFVARMHVRVGKTLAMKFEVENKSSHPIRFEEALHSYFNIGDIHHTSVAGLEAVKYVEKAGGTISMNEPLGGPITFGGETDRIYFDTADTCVINDAKQNRRIEISKNGSADTVVWNPWIAKSKAMKDFGDDEWPGMLCVETANVGGKSIELQPRQTHAISATVGTWPAK